jgi:hypothetical protein
MREDYPELLEAIVMRALERDPARRFQTSLEFARALESYLSASGLPAGAGDVGEFMQTLFADQIAMRDEVLRAGARLAPLEELVAVWQGSSPTPPPPPPPPEDDFEEVPSEAVTAPRGEHELNDESEAIPLTRSADDGPRTVYVASKSSRRAEGGSLGALFGAALAVVTLALVYLVLRPRPTPVRRAAVPTPVGRAPLRAPPRPATPPAVHDPLPTPAPPRVATAAPRDHRAGDDLAARGHAPLAPGIPLVHLHARGGRLRRRPHPRRDPAARPRGAAGAALVPLRAA